MDEEDVRDYVRRSIAETRVISDLSVPAPLEEITPDPQNEFKYQILALLRNWRAPPFEEIHGEEFAEKLRTFILTNYPELEHAPPPAELLNWNPPQLWRDYLEFIWETQSFGMDIETWIEKVKIELEMMNMMPIPGIDKRKPMTDIEHTDDNMEL
jgi:hypothetical protein